MTSKAKRTDRDQCRVQRLEAGAEMSGVNALEFKEELRRQVARLDPLDEAEAMRFIEAAADFSDD